MRRSISINMNLIMPILNLRTGWRARGKHLTSIKPLELTPKLVCGC